MKLTKRILCVVCALAMLLVAMPVAQMMTSAETASIGWNVMFDWENEGSHGDIVTTTATTAKDQKTTIGVREIDQYTGTATDFTFIEGSKKAVWFYNSKANISSSAPSTGEAPATIDLVPAQLEKATDLRVNLHKKPTTYTTENIYFGAVIGGVTYYHILDKAAYTTNAAYFSFVGQTLTSLADGSTKTVTADDIPNFTKLVCWVETEGYSALLVDNVEYYGVEVEAPTTTTVAEETTTTVAEETTTTVAEQTTTTASTTKKISVFDNTIYKLEARSSDCTSTSTITYNADGSISIQFPDDVRSTQDQIQIYTDHLDKDKIIAAGNKMKVDFTLDECWTNSNWSTQHNDVNTASFKSVNLGGNFDSGTKYSVGQTYTAEVDMSSVDWTKNTFVQLLIENYQNVMLGTDVTFMLYVEEEIETTTTTVADATTTTVADDTTTTAAAAEKKINLYDDVKPHDVQSAYKSQMDNSTITVTDEGAVDVVFPASTRAQQYQIQFDVTKLDKAAIEAAGNQLKVKMTGKGEWLKDSGTADGGHTKIVKSGTVLAGGDSGPWLKGGNSVTLTLDMSEVDYTSGTLQVIMQNYYGSGLTNVEIEVYLYVESGDDATTTTAAETTTEDSAEDEWVIGQYAPSNGIFTNTAANSQGRIAKTAKMDVTAGKAYKFDTGCEDEGIKFILRGYDADGNYVDLAKTSVGNAVLESGGVIVIPEGVAQLSISLYDVNNNANTRGQEMLDMIAAGTLAPTITETTEIPSTTATIATTTQPTTTEPPFDSSKYEREALIKWGATMTHWYSKTEGWLSNGVNDGDLGDNITCSKGTMKVNIANVKAQQANINFSMSADSEDCKELNALIDELIEQDAYIECDVKVVSAKKADGTDYQSITYKLKTNNGELSKESGNYTNVGETRTLRYKIADLVSFNAAKDVYSAGVMIFGGDWNSGFSELVVEISPIYYLKEVETTTTTTEAPTTTTTVADVTTTVADVTTTVADVTTTTANVPGVDTPDTPDVPTTVVGGKYETDVVQDPNAPVATDDSINVFSMEDKTAKAGDTIEVPVVLSNVDKIWGAQLNIAFDTNGLEFVSFAKGDVFVDVLENKNDVADGFISVLLSHNLTDGTDVDNVHEGGVVFTLTFKVLDTAAEGTYGVAFVDYDAESFFEIENDTVDVAFKSAIITVAAEEETTTSGAEDPTDATEVETPDAPEVDTPDDVETGDVAATTVADTTDANGNSTAPQTGAAAAPIAAAALAVAAAVVVFKSRKK